MSNRIKSIVLTASATLAVLVPSTASAVTAVAGGVNIAPTVQLAEPGALLINNSASSALGPIPGSAQAFTTSLGFGSSSSIVADGFARANWQSANVFDFSGFHRWTFGLTNNSGGGGAHFTNAAENFFYEFSTTGQVSLELHYHVTPGGNPFGLQGWNLLLNGSTILGLQDPFDPSASGTFTYSIGGPGTYRLSLVNNSNLGTQGDLNDYTGQVLGDFGFTLSEQVSGVPETATWGMMIAGFGFAGGALRRRPRVAVPFA